ncbi:MAG TPA: glutamate--tRNA ligase [Spirochaetota bacterium]|nr:glutamate--tRNA ligase [Spirochaetota bacterium]HPI90609.1 glutamate--tRNA ligase [Spirochaetota bacterium]HPR47729.1 glutamate--tRNA ligase [Spirochaetota bacterium]
MRVRFAPSPTGYIHIGNVRTAIINYLIARKNGASLVLRIEDTDMERSTKESERSIMDDLTWLGIEWNEGPDVGGGCGPYRQSERFGIYNEYTERLLREGKAYHCYCTQQELDAMRQDAEKQNRTFTYPGKCRHLSTEEKQKFEAEGRKPTVRFHVPEGETVTIRDHIKGSVTFSSENIGGDFIIVRSDGTPIYNYIVIIDDALMKISHVIRGEDHLSNTPKQILVARALDLPVPEYAHLSLVLGPDRSKLSKRHGITSLNMYREEGYLPEALINYLGMLGWASESGDEIIPIKEIISQIDITNLAKSAAIFDFQKLKWMNGKHLRELPIGRATDLFAPFIARAGYDISSLDRKYLEQLVSVVQIKCDILSDIGRLAGIFLDDVPSPDSETEVMLTTEEGNIMLKAARELVSGEINENNFATDFIPRIKETTNLKGKKLFMPLRAMITGRLQGPELDQALPLIGYHRCKKRIDQYSAAYTR